MRSNQLKKATGESHAFNLHALRRLYNKDQQGRGEQGVKNRYDMHPTITHLTFLALVKSVPVGRGQYGSPVIELSLRVMLCLIGVMPVDTVADELANAVNDRTAIVSNLIKLAKKVTALSGG